MCFHLSPVKETTVKETIKIENQMSGGSKPERWPCQLPKKSIQTIQISNNRGGLMLPAVAVRLSLCVKAIDSSGGMPSRSSERVRRDPPISGRRRRAHLGPPLPLRALLLQQHERRLRPSGRRGRSRGAARPHENGGSGCHLLFSSRASNWGGRGDPGLAMGRRWARKEMVEGRTRTVPLARGVDGIGVERTRGWGGA